MKRAGIHLAAQAVALISPVLAHASEHGAEGGHEGGKAALPQLDVALYPGLLFWLIVCFGLFFFFVKTVGLPGIQQTQTKRADLLGADLGQARKAGEEAQKVVADYETALAKARQEAHATVNGILQAAAKESDLHSKKLQDELVHRTKVIEENIASSRQKAMEEAPKHVNDLVLDLFDRLTKAGATTGARG